MMATQSYQISRSQHAAPRTVPKNIPIRRPLGMLPTTSHWHIATPVAAVLVEMLSRFI